MTCIRSIDVALRRHLRPLQLEAGHGTGSAHCAPRGQLPGRLLHHAASPRSPRAVGALSVPVIQSPLLAATMTRIGAAIRFLPGNATTIVGAVEPSRVAPRADPEQVLAPAAPHETQPIHVPSWRASLCWPSSPTCAGVYPVTYPRFTEGQEVVLLAFSLCPLLGAVLPAHVPLANFSASSIDGFYGSKRLFTVHREPMSRCSFRPSCRRYGCRRWRGARRRCSRPHWR
ncbi:uncharacterized protein CMC5_042350 [Chondromyces crocatus]|uniref:Uncharacterized protein n=1 Tax=Chondromyces crocatus TaxID=52 RepID=A0A0K1EHE2_CHOCO|nr:uncharacterized protein CMC5_042350 [Chondromyces crocatus]